MRSTFCKHNKIILDERVKPKTGAEIAKSDAIGAWADRGITDSVEWVKELRRKRREKRGWASSTD